MILPRNDSITPDGNLFQPNDADVGYYYPGFKQSEPVHGLYKYNEELQSTNNFHNSHSLGPHTASPSMHIPPPHPDLLLPLTTDEIIITPVRDISYADAKEEIINYKESVGNRKVYISEIAEKLKIDFDLIESIVDELQNE